MSNVTVRLERRESIARGTTAFHFSKPAGFDFKAGQAVDVVLLGDLAAEGANGRHAFSIVSAPSDPELVVATRMRDSAFKRALKDLPIGSPVELDGPFGSLTLHKNPARPAIFVAGGIGITPFMSMLRQAAKDRAPQRLALVYSNRRPEDSAFLPELQRLERELPAFRLVATMTQMNESAAAWAGLTGVIDTPMLRQVGADLPSAIYYLAGPPAMVAAVCSTLGEAGVDDDDIRVEEFYGY